MSDFYAVIKSQIDTVSDLTTREGRTNALLCLSSVKKNRDINCICIKISINTEGKYTFHLVIQSINLSHLIKN